MMGNHPFGERLHKHLTRQRGLSYRKLAYSIGVYPSDITRMCKGKFPKTMDVLRERILKIVGFLEKAGVIYDEQEIDGFFIDAGLSMPKNTEIEKEIITEEEKPIIELLIRGDISGFDDFKRKFIIATLSLIFTVDKESINILRIEKGSIKLAVEIPFIPLENIQDAIKHNKTIIKFAGINSVSKGGVIYYENTDKGNTDKGNILEQLSTREIALIKVILDGNDNSREIFRILKIDRSVFYRLLSKIYQKVGVNNKSDLIFLFESLKGDTI